MSSIDGGPNKDTSSRNSTTIPKESGNSPGEDEEQEKIHTKQVLQEIVNSQHDKESSRRDKTTEILQEVAREQHEESRYEMEEFEGEAEADTEESDDSEGIVRSISAKQRRRTVLKSLFNPDQSHPAKRLTRKEMIASRERLVKRKEPTVRYSHILEDDAANCTFKPRINSSSRSMGSKSGSSVLKRFQTAEEARQLKLERRRGEQEYQKKVDKKSCPKCKAVQSYDEFSKRKNKCRSCRVPYKNQNVWHEVRQNFLTRMQLQEEKRKEKLKRIARETTPKFNRPTKVVYDEYHNATRTIKPQTVYWNDISDSFITRMQHYQTSRERKALLLEAKEYNRYTFRPKTSGEEYHADRPFIDRMEQDISRRNRKVHK